MELKNLRIQKGLTQKECAEFLGMSTRNYQNYENKKDKINTIRYKAILKKLENYDTINTSSSIFKTNVITGSSILLLYEKVSKFEKRNCYHLLKRYIDGEYYGKICTLYGLRRTGKTTLMFQMIGELSPEETAYIKIRTTDTMSDLIQDLKVLNENYFKYIFIDEITLLEDFINTAAVLSDIFSMMGMKIVVSGTDSLGFALTNRDELYDRNIMIHTSFISFREYVKLLKLKSVDAFIEYGGTLKMENMSFDDKDFLDEEVSFKNDETTRKYIDTAISKNIQHSLKNDNYGEYFNELRILYENNELTNVINRIIENMSHRFLLSVIEEKFKSHDFKMAKNNLLHNPLEDRAFVLNNVNTEEIIKRLKNLIDVKDKNETKIKVTDEHINKIKKYLILLDLIVNIPVRYESGKYEDYYVFSQPGMRYSITKALVYSLSQDELFKSISEKDKDYIINKILEDVKGRMLEDIVLLEVKKTLSQNKEVFKFKFDLGGEYDMIIFDKNNYTCAIYEIKHSDKVVKEQTRHLNDTEKLNKIEHKYGKITKKVVLYRGKEQKVNDISYLNVENFLLNL